MRWNANLYTLMQSTTLLQYTMQHLLIWSNAVVITRRRLDDQLDESDFRILHAIEDEQNRTVDVQHGLLHVDGVK